MLYSIIGTRPQYIKVKPVYDYCLAHNIPHTIIDTNQHYSAAMSQSIIESLGINNICRLVVGNKKELSFMANLIYALYTNLHGKFAAFEDEDIGWALRLVEPDRSFFLYDTFPSQCIVETMNG